MSKDDLTLLIAKAIGFTTHWDIGVFTATAVDLSVLYPSVRRESRDVVIWISS